jgi:hypothetical protein
MAYLEVLLFWAVFGFAAASFAKGKNRSPLLWGLIGLLIGPFAVLPILLMKPGPGKSQGYD